MTILEKTKLTLSEKHPYNFTVIDEYSTDEWMVIMGYSCVSYSPEDDYIYLGYEPKLLLDLLEKSKDDNEIDNWIWRLNWHRDMNEAKIMKITNSIISSDVIITGNITDSTDTTVIGENTHLKSAGTNIKLGQMASIKMTGGASIKQT
jgi:hypothetical protein